MNRAFEGATRKGREAFAAGVALDGNPYGDTRTFGGQITFARAFWRAWRDGWKAAESIATESK